MKNLEEKLSSDFLNKAVDLVKSRLSEIQRRLKEGYTVRYIVKNIFNGEINIAKVRLAYKKLTGNTLKRYNISDKYQEPAEAETTQISEKQNDNFERRYIESMGRLFDLEKFKGKSLDFIPDGLIDDILIHLLTE